MHSGEAIAHILFVGPPGVDRQALIEILAKEISVEVKSVLASSIANPRDLACLLTSVARGDICFIEAIDTLEISLQEHLTTAMQDFKLDIVIDQGANARSGRLNLPLFAMIGSTDDSSKLSKRLLDQFVAVFQFEPLSAEGIAAILIRQSTEQKVTLEHAAALRIGEQPFGEMARAHKLLGWVSKYCHMKGCPSIEERTTVEAIRILTGEGTASDSQESAS